jgi:Ca2+-transporting ATPase
LADSGVPGPTQLKRYGLALLLTIAITGIGFLQRLFETTSLDFGHWWICIGIAASLVLMEEVIKLLIRRRDEVGVGGEAKVGSV